MIDNEHYRLNSWLRPVAYLLKTLTVLAASDDRLLPVSIAPLTSDYFGFSNVAPCATAASITGRAESKSMFRHLPL